MGDLYREKVFINCSNHPSKTWGEDQRAVMCQGEFTLSYAIIKRLKERGICAVAACSRREAEEILQEDGSTRKKVVFHFEGFREY